MALKRMDNMGIVLDDLDATIAFFRELGLDLEGQTTIEGGGKKGDSFRYGGIVNFDGTLSPVRRGYVGDAAGRFGIVVDFFSALPQGAAVATVRVTRLSGPERCWPWLSAASPARLAGAPARPPRRR